MALRAPYVERSFDTTLLENCLDFIRGGERARWLSLDTVTGRGNTSLLEHLHRVLKNDLDFRYAVEAILVPPPPEGDAAVAAPRPLVKAINGDEPGLPLRIVQFVWRNIWRHPYRVAGAFSLLILFGIPMSAIGVYLAAEGLHTWPGFLAFLRGHVTDNMVLFLFIILGPWLLTEITKLISVHERELTPEELARMSSADAIGRALLAHARDHQGVVLLLDKSHLLDRSMRALVSQILAPPKDAAALREFRGKYRLMVISVDEVQTWQELVGKSAKFQVLPVDEFTLAEVREIARAQNRALYARVAADDGEALETVDRARHDIRIIFGTRQEVRDEMQREYRDAESKNVSGDFFGPDFVMLYQAVRTLCEGGSGRTSTVEVTRWLRALKGDAHLRDFGIKAPGRNQAEKLVEALVATSMLTKYGRELVFDYRRARELVDFVRQADPPAAARAYVYWFEHEIAPLRPLSTDLLAGASDVRTRIGRAAVYARELVEFIDDAGPAFAVLSAQQRADLFDGMGSALLFAAILARRDGAIEQAIDHLYDALDLLAGATSPAAEASLQLALTESWECFWLSRDPKALALRDEILEKRPALARGAATEVQERFDWLRRGAPVQEQPQPADLPPSAANRWLLVDMVSRIRAGLGFLFSPRGEPVDLLEPAESELPDVCSTLVRQLSVYAAAANNRDLAADLVALWGERLEEVRPSPSLGDEILLSLDRGAYFTSALHARAQGVTVTVEPAEAARLAEHALDRALVLTSVAEWRGIAPLLTFQRGLLLRLAPPKSGDGAEWEAWENEFRECVAAESANGSFFLTPEIHMLRWEYFRQIAADRALDDGYDAYGAAKRVGIANRIVVDMHLSLQELFISHGGPEHGDRAAELLIDWARTLASTPEARRHWEQKYTRLEYEQAHALTFAAQARRNNDRPDDAEALLNEAESLLPAPDPADAAGAKIRQMIAFQRAMILLEKQERSAAHDAFRALWSTMAVDDLTAPVVLATIAEHEVLIEIAGEPWPFDGDEPLPDPDAPQLFADGELERGMTRFAYRFAQLVRIYHQAPANAGNIARTVLIFGALAMDHQLAAHRLVPMLEWVDWLEQRERNEGRRLQALRLLVNATNRNETWVIEYKRVLEEQQKLMDRDIENDLRSGSAESWFTFVNRIHFLYEVLVEDARRNSILAQTVRLAGGDPDRVIAEANARKGEYKRAENASDAAAMGLLHAALPAPDLPWVHWEDLHALQRWLLLADRNGTNGARREARAQQLRSFCARYVQQLSRTIDDDRIQSIAVKIIELLEQVAGVSRIPIRGDDDEDARPGGRGPAGEVRPSLG